MKLTDKCKQDFEKWFLLSDYREQFSEGVKIIVGHSILGTFYCLPLSMQYGVLVDFYSEKYLKITIQYHPQLNQYSFNIIQAANLDNIKPTTHSIYHIHYNGHCDSVYYDTEKETREQAIIKANEIYNENRRIKNKKQIIKLLW